MFGSTNDGELRLYSLLLPEGRKHIAPASLSHLYYLISSPGAEPRNFFFKTVPENHFSQGGSCLIEHLGKPLDLGRACASLGRQGASC